jgi:YHS domain-containing protein
VVEYLRVFRLVGFFVCGDPPVGFATTATNLNRKAIDASRPTVVLIHARLLSYRHRHTTTKLNEERNMTMNDSKTVTTDPICGMTVDTATALHAERDGKTFYFCSDHCREKFLSTPAGAKLDDKSGGCCG